MGQPDITVIHVVADDLSDARADALLALRASPQVAARQEVVHVGRGASRPLEAVRPVRVHAPLGLGRLRRCALVRTLARLGLSGVRDPIVWHAWSPSAARWCLPMTESGHRLLVEADTHPPQHCRRSVDLPATVAYACPSAAVQAQLRACGVPAERCALIRPFVDADAIRRDRRPLVRSQLGLADEHVAALVVPPITRAAGSFIVAWATLLVKHVCPRVRLIVPANGRQRDRIRRFVQACRHEHGARFVGADLPLRDLLVAADLALFLPPDDAATDGLAWAMAAGCPLVAANVPAVTELLTHARTAWLCRPGDVQDAAHWTLRAVEHPEQSRRQAEQARTEALALFSRSRMIAEYRRTYADLLAGRPVAQP